MPSPLTSPADETLLAGPAANRLALDAEALRGGKAGQVDDGAAGYHRAEAGGGSEDHIGVAVIVVADITGLRRSGRRNRRH